MHRSRSECKGDKGQLGAGEFGVSERGANKSGARRQ